MKTCIIGIILFIVCCPVFAGDHTFGVGVHYFYTLDDISPEWDDVFGDSFHRDGLAINFSYRYKFNPHVGILAEIQTYPDGYIDASSVVSPRVLVVLGQGFYVGGGIGWNNVDWEEATQDMHSSNDWTDSYFLLRAGFEFPIINQNLFLDFNANYEFNQWNEVQEFDSDILTFGAAIKITL